MEQEMPASGGGGIQDALLTPEQVGKLLGGMTPQAVRARIKRKQIPFVKIGRAVMIKASVVKDIVEHGLPETAEPPHDA